MLFRYENIKNSHSFIMPSLLSEQRNSLDVRWDFLFMVNQYHIEIWAWIPDYEGMYMVSTLGEVRSYKNANRGIPNATPIVLRAQGAKTGYRMVGLCNKGIVAQRCVHAVMAEAFLGHNPKITRMVVDHKDNNKFNNTLNNLQLISYRENTSKNRKNKNSTSKYTGVSWNINAKKWLTAINIRGKDIAIGYFESEVDAANAYIDIVKQVNIGGDVKAALLKYKKQPKTKQI